MNPIFQNRCAIRSAVDGRYRFSRYFGQRFNPPTTWEELVGESDVELYDLKTERRSGHGDEYQAQCGDRRRRGVDDGKFHPIRNGKWYFPGPENR